jgi:NAD(P)-dependent dehydrogenase (short-subunit alcohol dehydrogenase family)
MTLENRVAVITGATGGLGSVVTRQLASEGACLALLDRHSDRLNNLAGSMELPESRLLKITLDMQNSPQVNDAAMLIAKKFGKVDIVLHLVGGWTGGKTLLEVSPEDMALMLNQHLWTSYHVIQAFVPYLVKNGWGRILMISSPYANRPNAKGGPYAVGKSSQEALLLTLSQELKGTGITANLLQVKTIDIRHEKFTSPSSVNSSWNTPEELGSMILFLISDNASSINGARIPTYGSY